MNIWRDHIGSVVTFCAIVTAALCIALLSGCQSSSVNKITVPDGRFVGEVNHAFNQSRARLDSVGAPVRNFGERIIRYENGTAKGAHGWGRAQGNHVIGGLTFGKNVTMFLTPDGQPQPLLWELESAHSWLQGIEESDYGFIQQAYPEWRKP